MEGHLQFSMLEFANHAILQELHLARTHHDEPGPGELPNHPLSPCSNDRRASDRCTRSAWMSASTDGG